MSSNKTIGLILAIVGVIIAIVGLAVLLVEDIDLSDTYAYALIIVGVVVAVIGILFMYFLGAPNGSNKEKAPKQKAPKAEKPAKAAKAKSGSKASAVANLGDSPLAKAIKFGADKLDAKIAAGKVGDKDAELFFQRLMAFAPKVGTPEEEASIPLVSQVIGAIASA